MREYKVVLTMLYIYLFEIESPILGYISDMVVVENWRRRQFFLFFCVVTGWDYSYFPIVIYNHTESDISRRHHILVMEHFFKGMWGSFGTGDGEFDRPRGIAVDSNGNVYVADSGNNRIQKFNSTGIFLDKWGERGNGEGQFINPIHIAIDSNNDIYVTEDLTGIISPRPLRTRIQKFTRTGVFIKQWGELAGTGDGEFFQPRGIAVESDDDILVVDSQNFRIQKFTNDGQFIRKWGRYEPGDDRNWHLGSPIDIAVDSNDDNYVIDAHTRAEHYLVKKFDRGGNFIRKWGLHGTGDGEFNRPEEIATFSGNSLLVVDSQNHRIQEFSRDGVFITKWGSPGQFQAPTGVAINKIDDMHYISDTGNHRVQRYHWDPAVP
jgi:DNA-binding beta-propeller fold protein YncE